MALEVMALGRKLPTPPAVREARQARGADASFARPPYSSARRRHAWMSLPRCCSTTQPEPMHIAARPNASAAVPCRLSVTN